MNAVYFPISPDHHLLHVIALNVSRAVLTNFHILSLVPKDAFSTPTCCENVRIFQLPTEDMDGAAVLPNALSPTRLQQQVPHFGWVDLFPSSQLRDNIIRAFANPHRHLDEDELLADLIGSVFENLGCVPVSGSKNDIAIRRPPPAKKFAFDKGPLVECSLDGSAHEGFCFLGETSFCHQEDLQPSWGAGNPSSKQAITDELGLISWSDPWDVNGWEFTPKFARKWGFLLRGCVDVIEATNRWREQRGEEPLIIEV